MKHIHFDVDKAGFYGAYWENIDRVMENSLLGSLFYECTTIEKSGEI